MKYLITTVKILAKTIAGIFVFLWCYVMAVGIGETIVVNDHSRTANGTVTCYVQNSGVHTDIIMPANTDDFSWTAVLPTDDYEQNTSFDYIGFGWGDRGFFMETPTWDDLKISTALGAMFWPSESVMHAFYAAEPVAGPMVKEVMLTKDQYLQLVDFIRSSFAEAEENPTALAVMGDYYPANDRFYLGEGSYFFTYTCNVWTNQALKSCGVQTPVWSPFPDAIMQELDKVEP
jgi:uncharacterized protein (TIGR02117 family)